MRRHILCRLICIVLLLPILLFLFGNLWLGSSHARALLAGKLGGKLGTDCQISGLSWTPFEGLLLEGVHLSDVEQPITLCDVRSVRVEFYYARLLRGEVRVKELDVLAPKVSLTRAQLEQIMDVQVQAVGTMPKFNRIPPVVVGPDTAPPIVIPPVASHPVNPPTRPKVLPPTGGQEAPRSETVPVAKQRGEWALQLLQVRNATIELLGEDGGPLISITGLSTKLPIEELEGVVEVRAVELKGVKLVKDGLIGLSNDASGLRAQSVRLNAFGSPIQLSALVDKSGGLELRVSYVKEELEVKKEWGVVGIAKCQLLGEMAGGLMSPRSWRGNLQWLLDEVELDHPAKDLTLKRVVGVVQLQQLQLHLRHFHADGGAFQLRSEGVMLSNGQVQGVLRLQASEQEAEDIIRFAGGVQVQCPMGILQGNDDWRYNDVLLRGGLWDLEFQSYRKWHRLKDVLSRSKGFMESELLEGAGH